MKKLFTSESVTKGHPDKICDQISDAILDAYLVKDQQARVACETMVTNNLVIVIGEITSTAKIDIEQVIRKVIIAIGYDKDEYGFNGHTCEIMLKIKEQSSDIRIGVNKGDEIGAGDQGLMFGYANNETTELMPLPIVLAHNLAKRLDYVRNEKLLGYLRPDGKTQVTVEYVDNKPKRVDTILISTQHDDEIDYNSFQSDIINHVVKPVINSDLIDLKTKIIINPTGRFVIGGPVGDAGLTGRKIIIDTYGGYARHGGGAFSGKDATKVDRSGAYLARHIAKNIVAAGLAYQCEVQISYAIGMINPVSLMIDTFNTGKYSNQILEAAVTKIWDLTPKGIINDLNLLFPIYQELASYGHMGRVDLLVAWEQNNKVDELIKVINIDIL